MSGRLTHTALRALDRVNRALLRKPKKAEHLQTGRRGEEDAYFYLRELGYVMVARNWRSPRRKGELDLVGWDGDCLCFVEVKTRTTHDVKPAEAAVDAEKQQELSAMAREFLRLFLTSRAKRESATPGTDLQAETAGSRPQPAGRLNWWLKFLGKIRGGDRAPSLRSGCEKEASAQVASGSCSAGRPSIRFDVLSIYYLEGCGKPQFALFKNCFPMS